MDLATPVPSLNPLLKLHPSAPRYDGQPQWTLYHPVSNQFYKIGWAEYECLSRLHRFETVGELIDNINTETSLNINEMDVEEVIKFLAMNGLLDGKSQQNMEAQKKPLMHRLLHGYLYFTFPLLKPNNFLKNTAHLVKPFLSRQFHIIMMVLLVVGVLMTLPRLDEFLSSFTQIFTLEGIILSFVILTSIKIIHEFAHGYVATVNGVSVPHMGVAFIVLYPILYTEATGTWRLTDKRARMAIGLAGVRFELYLATIAIILWHFVTPGLAQMMCFTVAMISLVGSLLVNLNPLMRFDGYYVLSDYLNIENLHTVALDYARHSLRSVLLGLNDDVPHDYSDGMARSLTVFGYAIIIYRFFLFLGISVLVYAVFMKPLGLIAMILELVWFIGLPILKELSIWWERRSDFMGHIRFLITSLIVMLGVLWLCLPMQSQYSFPAVMHVKDYQVAYAPVASTVKNIHVGDGENVKVGDRLVTLESKALTKDIALANADLQSLQNLIRRDQTNVDLYRERRAGGNVDLETAKKNLENLRDNQDDLVIKAKFDGVVYDVQNMISRGQGVKANDPILRVVAPSEIIVTAYVPESDRSRIAKVTEAVFRPNYDLIGGYQLTLSAIEETNVNTIEFSGLASVYGGEIASQKTQDSLIEPINTLTKVVFSVNDNRDINMIDYGHVILKGDNRSFIFDEVPRWVAKAKSELSLN